MSAIPEQVRLPFSAAFEVVMQGLKIRLGRSVVTLTGIVLGVAFLMSILASNHIRSGVGEETALRQETERMLGFLTSGTGPLPGRSIAVLAGAKPDEAEIRLLEALEAANVSEIRWFGEISTIPAGLQTVESFDEVEAAGTQASGVLLVGGFSSRLEVAAALAGARQPVLATFTPFEPVSDSRVIQLNREPLAGEQERIDARAARDLARSIWITSIALLVTMISISNSLLMSVTERFKEIGTMKCLGALSSFIRRVFFIESSLLGILGSMVGAVLGFLFALVMYGITYGFGITLTAISPAPMALLFLVSVLGGLGVSILAAIYPANFASRMVPATALRTNI